MTSTEHHPTTSLSAALAVVREEIAKLKGPIDPGLGESTDDKFYREGFRDGLDEGAKAMRRVEEFIVDLGHQIDELVRDYTS